MKCPQCSTDLPDSAKFCGACGFHIAASSAAAVATRPSTSSSPVHLDTDLVGPAPTGRLRSYEEIAAGPLELPAMEILSEAWARMKPQLGLLVGGGFLVFLVGMMASGVPIVGGFLMVPILAGINIVVLRMLMGRSVEISTFFDSFKMFMPLFLLGIVSGLLTMLGFLFLVIPGVFLSIAWMWSTWLVVDRKDEFWPAMQGSMAVAKAHFGAHFVFALVIGLMNMAAAIPTCGLGLLLTMPLTYVAMGTAYARIFGIAGGADKIEG